MTKPSPLIRRTVLLCALAASTGAWADISARNDVQGFIDRMVSKHGFARAPLQSLFSKVEFKPEIIRAMTRPAEAKPWSDYRPIFVTDARAAEGAEFWRNNAAVLDQAEQRYGVAPQIVTAIIGVETRYGRHAGHFRVADALSTLAFDYPPRAKFFTRELEHFLLMSREEHIDPIKPLGSYAGAMGQGQFIPSSFRSYAVDFDHDGHRDLWDSTADAVGSVANYLSRHGWERGAAVATPAEVQGEGYKSALDKGMKPSLTVAQLEAMGVKPEQAPAAQTPAALIELDGKQGAEHWLVMNNFYVITRYNHSPLYAMAVYQLSEAIGQAYRKPQ